MNKLLHTAIQFLYSNRLKLIICSVISLGVFLRLYRVVELQDFYGDPSRDLLVASHLLYEKSPPLVTPYASGGNGILVNSPLYFYLLKGMLWTVNDYQYIVVFFSLAGILSIFLAYQVGVEIQDKKLGALFACFIASSFPLFFMSRVIWQPHLIPVITLLTILSLFKAQKNNSFYWFGVSFVLSILGICLHYSFAPIFAGLHVFYLSILLIQLRKRKFSYLLFVAAYTYILFRMFLKLSLSNNEIHLSILNLFNISPSAFVNWDKLFSVFLTHSFGDYPIFKHPLLHLGIIITAITFLLHNSWKNKCSDDAFNSFFLLMIASSTVVLLFYNGPLLPHYITPYYVLLPLLFSYLICNVKSRYILFFSLIMSTAVVFQGFIKTSYIFTSSTLSYGSLQYEKKVTELISNDYRERLGTNSYTSPLSAVILDTNDFSEQNTFISCINCSTGSTYLLLEQLLNTHLVKLVANKQVHSSYTLLEKQPKYFYLLCRLHHAHDTNDPDHSLLISREYCLPLLTNQQGYPVYNFPYGYNLLSEQVITINDSSRTVLFVVQPKSESL